jgi:hypothetical protein
MRERYQQQFSPLNARTRSDDAGAYTPSPSIDVHPAAVMRKSSCACGGGCPTCQSNSGLKVSSPNDSAELEADRIADTVMRKSDDDSHGAAQSHVHVDQASIFPKREFSTPGHAVGGEIGERIASSRGKGAALDTGTRGFMESRFATDLGGVRVHAGNEAAELNSLKASIGPKPTRADISSLMSSRMSGRAVASCGAAPTPRTKQSTTRTSPK